MSSTTTIVAGITAILLTLPLVAHSTGNRGLGTMRITAYCDTGRTALGTRGKPGTCAASRGLLRHWIAIQGIGRFKVTDVCPKRNTIDIFIPSRKKCLLFGVKRKRVLLCSD